MLNLTIKTLHQSCVFLSVYLEKRVPDKYVMTRLNEQIDYQMLKTNSKGGFFPFNNPNSNCMLLSVYQSLSTRDV